MIATIHSSCFASALEQLHSRFLGILPRVERHAKIYFRHIVCRQKRTDLIAETVALAWKWFVRLAEKGRDGTEFPTALASYAAKAVRSGRRVCGQERARDVMSQRAQQRHGFCIGKLPDFSTESTNPLAEALTDNSHSPIPDQVQFRCDFPAWLRTRTQRDRHLIERMAMRERTTDLARKFGLSEGRVSQLRQEFYEDWNLFGDEAIAVA